MVRVSHACQWLGGAGELTSVVTPHHKAPLASTSSPSTAPGVNRRDLRPATGVQSRPGVTPTKIFIDEIKRPPWVGPGSTPAWVNLRSRLTIYKPFQHTNGIMCKP